MGDTAVQRARVEQVSVQIRTSYEEHNLNPLVQLPQNHPQFRQGIRLLRNLASTYTYMYMYEMTNWIPRTLPTIIKRTCGLHLSKALMRIPEVGRIV